MREKILSQSLAYGVATIIARGALLVSLLVFPIILNPADYGALAVLLAVGALVASIVPVEVAQGLARYFPGSPAGDQKMYASTAWWFSLFMLGSFVAVCQIFSRSLCTLILGSEEYISAFRVGLLVIAATSIFSTIQSQFRWEFRTTDYVLVSIGYSILTLVLPLLSALWLPFPPLLGILVGQAAGAFIAIVVGAFRLRGSFVNKFDSAKLCKMLSYSAPLVPASLAFLVSVYSGRLLLNGLASLADVGIYTFASQVAAIASLPILGIQAALTPLIIAHHSEATTPPLTAQLFETFVALVWPVTLLLGFFATDMIAILGMHRYTDAGALVMILAPASLMMQLYIFFPGFVIAKKTLWQMWISIASAIVCVLANILLINIWGIFGAAAGTLLSASTFLLLWLLFSQRLYPIPVRWLRVSAFSALAAAAGTVGLTLNYPDLGTALAIKTTLALAVTGMGVAIGLLPLARGIQAGRNILTGRSK